MGEEERGKQRWNQKPNKKSELSVRVKNASVKVSVRRTPLRCLSPHPSHPTDPSPNPSSQGVARQVCVRILPCLTRKLDCLWVDETVHFLPIQHPPLLPLLHSFYMAFVSVCAFLFISRQVKHTQTAFATSKSSGKLG